MPETSGCSSVFHMILGFLPSRNRRCTDKIRLKLMFVVKLHFESRYPCSYQFEIYTALHYTDGNQTKTHLLFHCMVHVHTVVLSTSQASAMLARSFKCEKCTAAAST